MFDQMSKCNTLTSFIQMALMFEATINHQNEKKTAEKSHLQDQAYSQLNSLFQIFIQADVFKSGIQIFPIKMNFCGVLASHLSLEILKHKTFANGLISVAFVKIFVAGGDHEFILINGAADNIKPDTIICNILRNEIFCGEQARLYLNSLHATKITYEFTNKHPNFDDFIYGKRELYNFLSQVKNVCFTNNNRSNQQIPIIEFLSKTAYDLMVQKPNIAEKTFEFFRKQNAEASVSLIKAMVRDYKSVIYSNAAALTSFPPESIAKASAKNIINTTETSRPSRKP
jgi:hypothetical protein